jgi:glycosyltransferase involved in cell wall biosynthesis
VVLYYADAHDEAALQLFQASGVDVRRVPRRGRFSPGFLRRLTRLIESERPDVVHCWLVSACLWGGLAAHRARAGRIVWSYRSSLIELSPLLRAARRWCDRGLYHLANTRAVAAAARRHVGAPEARLAVIPNGIELAPARDAGARAALLAAHREPPATRIVLSVGRLAMEKNYPMLLRVASRFSPDEPVRFFIVGHGELEVALRDQAKRLGVLDRVHFLGLRDDVPDLLPAADLFAFTSRIEGAPNALLEAMAAGRPIVSTRFDGLDDLLVADRDARVVDHDDDRAFEEAVRGLLADRPAAEALGQSARRTVTERFGVSAMVEATLSFYRRILASSA